MDIQYFSSLSFFNAAKQFFSDLQIPVNYFTEQPADLSEILTENYNLNNPGQSIVEDVYYIGLIDDNAFQNKQTQQKPENLAEDYEGIVIFGLTLDKKTDRLPTRTELGDIIRAFNREFPYTPVVIIFKYEEYITFANVERLKYKQPWQQGEKPGKVSMVKDINTQNVHTGHLKILKELEIKREGKDAVNTLKELYNYWQKVFSISILNETFYKELFEWYEWAINKVQFPSEPQKKDYSSENDYNEALQTHRATNVIRLLTRIVFSWFMKEKNQLIPDALFDKNYLDGILTNDDFSASNYYKAILQNLFFATLNQEMNTPEKPDNRKFAVNDGFSANKNQYGVKNLYRYQHLFKINENEVVDIFNTIPFLNGGLFDCLDKEDENKKVVYVDGFSRNPKMQPVVPDELFWGAVSNKGLIEILESYKFTIAENTPVEEEVALDPELLGKVFENLLASYNPETKTTARKKTGSYYTPREIVNYMVDESLVAYFENAIIDALEKGNPDFKVFIPKPQKDLFGKSQPTQGKLVAKKIVVNEEERSELNKNLHTLISYENHENPFTDNKEVNLLLNAIDNIKILDPACGSGAFPMGVLQKLVYVLGKLDPENQHWKEQQEKRAEKEKEEKIKKLESDIETVQKLSQEEVKKMAIEELEKRKEEIRHAKEHNDPDYLRKLYLIRNCIYGVDIQPIAVQISKLRFFISLLIEQNINESLPNNGIQALPNLETKFVAADTLVGVDRPGQGNVAYMLTGKLEEQLKMVREQHFNPHTRKEKLELQRKDKTIREKIASELKTHGWDEETADKLAKWDIYNQNEHADFFDKDWMFGIKDGFDVVLGNPPFIEHKKIKNAVKKIKNSYEAYSGTADLYVYFYEKGTKLLNKKGSLCLISSNKFLKTVYGKNLRRFLLKHKVCQLIDFSDVHVFDALVASSIILVNNSKAENNKIVAISIGDDFANYSNLNQYIEKRHFLINQSTLSEKTWLLENGDNLKIKLHIDNFSKRINEFENISIYRGITTGYNPAYIIDKNTREKLINNDSNNANIIYPLLQGRNIKKWVYAYSDNYLIFVPWHFPLHEDKSINGASEKAEKEFARQYSPLYNYLLSFKKELSNRNKEETGIRYEWYALQRCANTYYPEFEKEKIVWGLTADKWAFAYDNQKHFLPSNGYILTSEVIPIKYILALLNSDLMKFYFSFEGIMTAGGAYTLKHGTINELPLYDANEEIHNMLISLVDYILFCLNGDDIINSVPNEHLAQFFESVINGCVYELYFEEHMKEKEIDILQFVQADVLPIEGKSETEKAGIIKQVYEKWREHKSPVRNRLLLFASRSEIISKIENGG